MKGEEMNARSIVRKLDSLFWIAGIVSVVFLLVMNSGCGSTKVSTENTASVGQQLLDLQKAHDQGLVSDKEYEKLRKAIVKKND
jgi:hypothetical protein